MVTYCAGGVAGDAELGLAGAGRQQAHLADPAGRALRCRHRLNAHGDRIAVAAQLQIENGVVVALRGPSNFQSSRLAIQPA